MSYNNLVNSITNTNQILPKIEIFDEPKNILTREEKLDAFLETKVVDKFKQKWKDLTLFLRTNRIKLFIDKQESLTDIERKSAVRKISNMLVTGKLKNADIDYNSEEGLIESIKGFTFNEP
jgi:hypothetical protein